ncbi:MAG: hypothetical protein ABL940_08070 [Bacteroidia bacterium]
MKHIFLLLISSLLTSAFVSINKPCKAVNLLVQTTTNDTLITTDKLANTTWQIVKYNRLSKKTKEYKEIIADANNIVLYRFNSDNTCVITNGTHHYNCVWTIKDNYIIITENTEHNVFKFYVKNITSSSLTMVKSYKGPQESFILLNKVK